MAGRHHLARFVFFRHLPWSDCPQLGCPGIYPGSSLHRAPEASAAVNRLSCLQAAIRQNRLLNGLQNLGLDSPRG